MKTGLLWHDSGPDPLEGKLGRAVARYVMRFATKPNVCYVHPTYLPDGERTIDGVTLKPSSRILRHHFWIGVERDHPPGQEYHNRVQLRFGIT